MMLLRFWHFINATMDPILASLIERKSGKNIFCATASFLPKNHPSWFSPQTMSLVDTFSRSRDVRQPITFWKWLPMIGLPLLHCFSTTLTL